MTDVLKQTLCTLFLITVIQPVFSQELGTISGTVLGNDNQPEEDVHLFLAQTAYGTSTDANGKYKITGVQPGDYFLSISKVGFKEVQQVVTVKASENTIIDVTLITSSYQLDEVAVYGQKRQTIYATRLNAPLEQTPMSVNIIPRELLVQQQAISLEDALKNVSGVTRYGYYGLSDNINIRGFDIGLAGGPENYRINGVMVRTPYSDYVEQVQVLKGPASILYGDVEPGGIINYVTKKPLGYDHSSIEIKLGQFGLYRPSIDVGGKLGEKLNYRMNTVYESSESFRDNVSNEQFMIAPSLEWEISDKTSLLVDGIFMRNQATIDWGMPLGLSLQRVKQLKSSNFYGYPDGNSEGNNNMISTTFSHLFATNWEVRNVLAFSNQKRSLHDVYPVLNEVSDSVEFSWGDYRELSRTNTISNFVDVSGQIVTGPLRHKVLVAFDISQISRPVAYNFSFPAGERTTLSNPSWENTALSSLPILNDDEVPYTLRTGFNIQDLISFMDDRLNILIGGRFSSFTTGTYYRGEAEKPEDYNDTQKSRFTPRVGFTFELFNGVSAYASYAESFSSVAPSPGRGLTDPQPLVGNQIEFGVKQSLLDDKLGITTSFFDLQRKNVLQFDIIDQNGSFTDPGNFRANQSGQHSSRGVELDINGKLLDNWQVYAAFSYIKTKVDSEIIQDGDAEPVDYTGFELPNNPHAKYSIWTQYTFQRGIPGLSTGLGIFHQGKMYGDRLNTEENVIGDFTRIDAMVGYQYRHMRIQLNVQNLSDAETFQRSLFGSFIPQLPRRVIGSIAFKF